MPFDTVSSERLTGKEKERREANVGLDYRKRSEGNAAKARP